MASSTYTWALNQLSRLLPLDESSLKQIIEYSSSLPKDAAAENLKNLLGDSPQALEFIASFNSRRKPPKTEAALNKPSEVPDQGRKKQCPLPTPRISEYPSDAPGGYRKTEEPSHVFSAQHTRRGKQTTLTKTHSLAQRPFQQLSTIASSSLSSNTTPKAPPSAAGHLISDLPNARIKSRNNSRNASPAPSTKIALSGGTPMHGASSNLIDLDSAISALEIQTNPSISTSNVASRRCDCQGQRHPLLTAVPNCLNCGKIICVKEGIGPCTFCSYPLLSSADTQAMVHALREERGRERMDANNASYRRAEVTRTPRPFQQPVLPADKPNNDDSSLPLARAHRDKLLNYQAQNARRTRIVDEAADFETPAAGQSIWSSPMERAAQLKKQQQVLRQQEWNARPEYEKRKTVISISLVGGKAVKRMEKVARDSDKDEGQDDEGVESVCASGNKLGGAFSRNPLMGNLIRPVWKAKTSTDEGGDEQKTLEKPAMWRRVQDDNDDNETLILDGGVYGGKEHERILGDEERAGG